MPFQVPADRVIAWIVILVLIALPVVGVRLLLRDRRKGADRGSASSLVRAGLLDAQNLLEPDRKIEVVREAESKRDLLVEVQDDGERAS